VEDFVLKRVAVGVVVLAMTVAGCSGDEQSAGSGPGGAPAASGSRVEPTGAPNAQDLAFVSGMARHHDQMLELAKLAATRATGNDIRDFARGIERSRTADVRTLNGWLRSWHASGPPAVGEGGEVPGLLAPEDVDEVKQASGGEFDWMYLTMLMEQEQGEAALAAYQVQRGQHPDVIAMARAIQQRSASELTKTQELLGSS
jgi:uncharacterized protein (DUF305 family)